jgi:hypothetical protein
LGHSGALIPPLFPCLRISLFERFVIVEKDFFEIFGEKIALFYLRFLETIQVSGAPIELVNEVMNALDFSGISQNCLEVRARDSRIFDLISSSQVIREHSGRNPRQTRAFFASLFLLGYALPDPSKVVEMGRAIVERFETDPAAFSMTDGAFLPSNCRFEYMFTGIASSILGKSHETIKAGRSEILHPGLKLVLLIVRQRALGAIPVICLFIVNFVEFICPLIPETITILPSFPPENLTLFRGLSNVMLIVAELICCPSVNFGIFRLYHDSVFDTVLTGLFDACFSLSFDDFLRDPKFVQGYLDFMSSIFKKDLTLFLQQSARIVTHHMHLLLVIVQQDSREMSVAGAEVLLELLRRASFSSELDCAIKRTGKLRCAWPDRAGKRN